MRERTQGRLTNPFKQRIELRWRVKRRLFAPTFWALKKLGEPRHGSVSHPRRKAGKIFYYDSKKKAGESLSDAERNDLASANKQFIDEQIAVRKQKVDESFKTGKDYVANLKELGAIDPLGAQETATENMSVWRRDQAAKQIASRDQAAAESVIPETVITDSDRSSGVLGKIQKVTGVFVDAYTLELGSYVVTAKKVYDAVDSIASNPKETVDSLKTKLSSYQENPEKLVTDVVIVKAQADKAAFEVVTSSIDDAVRQNPLTKIPVSTIKYVMSDNPVEEIAKDSAKDTVDGILFAGGIVTGKVTGTIVKETTAVTKVVEEIPKVETVASEQKLLTWDGAVEKNFELQNVVTRTTRDGEDAVRITKPDGSVIDISAERVKEYVPNTHPSAPSGTLQKIKFEDSLPGSKGYKRAPTQAELDILNSGKK